MLAKSSLGAVLLGISILSGCQTVNPGLGERDQYVVSSPEVRANRVLYADTVKDTSNRRFVPLVHPDEIDLTNSSIKARIAKNNEPLSIIINSVWLALPEQDQSKTFDIAVVLTIEGSQKGGMQQIAAWYQTDTPLDDRLNFGDLLIYQQDSWDSAKPVSLRVRIIDVTAERNIRTRIALDKVREFGGNVLLAAQNPFTNAIYGTAIEAASLLLTNKNNRVLLDYTANFYSAQTAQQGGLDLTPLLLGRIVVVGSKEAAGSLRFDERLGSLSDTNSQPIRSPVVVMSVSDSDLQLSPFTLAKSTYITNLINTATQGNATQYEQSLKTFSAATQALAASERLRRSRNVSDLPQVAASISKPEVPDDVASGIVRRLSHATGCRFLTKGGVQELSDKIKAADDAVFDPETGKLPEKYLGKLCPAGQA